MTGRFAIVSILLCKSTRLQPAVNSRQCELFRVNRHHSERSYGGWHRPSQVNFVLSDTWQSTAVFLE